jgi:hypothetical protein
MKHRFSFPGTGFCGLLLLIVLVAAVHVRWAAAGDEQDPLQTVDRYMRAIYARDYDEAYRYIADRDRRLKDRTSYARDRGAFNGFTLEVARKLASFIQWRASEKQFDTDRATITVQVKVPDSGKLASLLHEWESDKLDALSHAERGATLAKLETLHGQGRLDMIEGADTFQLIKENDAWKIFLDWAAGVSVSFRTAIPSNIPVQAQIERSQVASGAGKIFQVGLKIKNTGQEQLLARIGHLVDPHEFRDYLDLVECGFLLPVRLAPGKEEEFTSTYLLRGSLPESVRELSVTYAVTLVQ